jgi:ribonuclease Z
MTVGGFMRLQAAIPAKLPGRGRPLSLGKRIFFLEDHNWNLVENYTNDFAIIATELHPDVQTTKQYRCRTAFQPETLEEGRAFDRLLVETRFFTVHGVFLDHLIPCLAFRFEERQRFNILKTVLKEMDLPTGG